MSEFREIFNNWKKSTAGQTAIEILKKDQRYLCPSCFGNLREGFHVHHLFPISKMNYQNASLATDIKNLVLLCPKCNLKQGARIDERFSSETGKTPKKLISGVHKEDLELLDLPF